MTTDNITALFGISDAARRVGVAENTLRKYERSGIVHPQRDSTGKRLFTEKDIEQARQHRARRSSGERDGE